MIGGAQLASVLWAAARRASTSSSTSSTLSLIRHFGGIGLIPLAIIDSSIIPTFGSLDLLSAWLAARNADLWIYYAAMSTVGSLIGAWITYRMGLHGGRNWMARRIGEKRCEQIHAALDRWGSGAILVSTVAPPPFPTSWFFLAAGAFHRSGRKFLPTVAVGRAVRYTLICALAAHYGRRFLRLARHPEKYLLICLVITVALILITVVLLYLRRRAPTLAPQAEPRAPLI